MRFKVEDIDWRYINLDHREDRRKHIHSQLEKVGIEAQRFAACIKEDYKGPPEWVAKMQSTPNTIGNWLSHTALMKRAADTGGVVGVLEDDALLCSDMQKRLQYVEENFKADWDIFFLGATFHDNKGGKWHTELGRDFQITAVDHIVRVYGAFSNQGYLVNGKRAGRLLERMRERMPHSRGSDHALIQLQPEFNCFCFVPGMVFQIDGPSDIGEGVTKFSNFLKSLGQYAWTDTLEEFDFHAWKEQHLP